ncbi:MAG: hypothetical protein IJY07_03005, partial [Clostridia bacterium]|nr:hypothetical protein [Clostridia bacterium]
YNRTMHASYFYDGQIDIDALKKAYMAVVAEIPVLHSTYHNNFIKPYWVINDTYSPEDFFSFVETDDPIKELDDFMGFTVPANGRVQFRARVIRSQGKDILGVVVNHMCFDGSDMRYFNIKVVETYNQYVKEGILAPDIKKGTRSADQVYYQLSEEDQKIAKGLYKNISTVENKVTFPFAKDDGSEKCRLVREKLCREDFLKMKAKGKEMGATINDVLLAAYFRTLYKYINTDGASITVPCMYDLRKYTGGSSLGLTNMIGFMPCTLSPDVGETMADTVQKVKASLQGAKDDRFTGLYSLPLLKLAYTILPHCISEIAIRIGYTNPYIGMSNIGIINPLEFAFDGLTLIDAFYSGAVKYKPYMQLALTTFQNEITFSVGIRGNDQDAEIFHNFMKDIIQEIQTFSQN